MCTVQLDGNILNLMYEASLTPVDFGGRSEKCYIDDQFAFKTCLFYCN